jgi:hypothetical protein
MITTYLRLDLFHLKDAILFDRVDLELHENVSDLLLGFDNADYVELYLIVTLGSRAGDSSQESYVASFQKDKKNNQWIVCARKEEVSSND